MRKVVAMVLLLQAAVGFLWLAGQGLASEQDIINSIVDARSAIKPFALPSAKLPDLNEEKAYALQKQLSDKLASKSQAIGGFKAGLTSEAGQQKFGVKSALLGPLFKPGELGPDAVVNAKDFVRLFVETEIAYIPGTKIDKPVADVDALKKLIKEVCPAIELPDLRFDDLKGLKGTDLIVDAVSSSKYIVGKRIPSDSVDVSQVTVTLTLDGNVVNQGKADDVMGDQWKALLWLVNGAISRGYVIEPGQILITGAMGNMIPGKPGSYQGDWGKLGKISWTIK
ncbi:MAG: 2-keto-4-pentenoate hydratase [Thermodesulfobacteriota bacterium]|nr:2-keto-4-pentenoate hydratase [Thermodesulfobacteriota bacterium]